MNNEIFDQYHFKIQQNMPKITGKALYPAKVLDSRNKPCAWEDYEKGQIAHTEPIRLKDNWVMVYSEYDFQLTTNCFEMMQKASSRFGISVNEP